MGILRNKEIQNGPIRIEDCEEDDLFDDYANYLFDSDFTDSDEDEPPKHGETDTLNPMVPCQRRKKSKRFRRHGPTEVIDGLPVKRNMGAQKWRRVENAKMVASFADAQDVCFDGSDLLPETITAFTRLLRDEAKMKMWNEFVEKDEMEQKKIILQLEYEIMIRKSKESSSPQYTKKDETAMRRQHPAFSTEICFQRLDKKFRDCLVKRRNIQFGYLSNVERTLRRFFSEFSTDTYMEELSSRIHRFYIHAVAQFLQLKSQTIEEKAKKVVEVKNEASSFDPPALYLVTVLKKKRHKQLQKKNKDEWEEFDELGIY